MSSSPEQIYSEAHNAGMVALNKCVPRPMVVNAVDKSYYVEDGLCGFAYIIIRPARGQLISWLKKNNIGRKHYNGGYSIFVGEGDQSVAKKEAYAKAFAEVLKKYDINCHVETRLD
jgi:hypothetical protein